MSPILLCWPTKLEADVGDLAVEVELSRQYSFEIRLPCDCGPPPLVQIFTSGACRFLFIAGGIA